MRTLFLAVLVCLSGCFRRVIIPSSPEGSACWRECVAIGNQCRSMQQNDFGVGCSIQQRDCNLSCPGAYEE